MAYAPSRIVTVKTEVSPSSLWNNLAVTSSTVVRTPSAGRRVCTLAHPPSARAQHRAPPHAPH
ncbi:hypothetical protein EON66_01845 [archaeon]|nr:MAG: hypothetical protein EON66_01845 [archaeon]